MTVQSAKQMNNSSYMIDLSWASEVNLEFLQDGSWHRAIESDERINPVYKHT